MLCLAKAGRLATALALLPRIQRDPEEKIYYAQLRAQVYFVAKQWDRSLDVLNKALAIFPDAAQLYYDRAMVLVEMKRLAQGEADLRRALALAPDNPTMLNGLGFTLITRNPAEAETLLRRARAHIPDDVYIEDSWGWLLYHQGKLAESEKVLTGLFFMHKNPDVIAHYVEVLLAQKKSQEARAVLQLGLSIYPNNDYLQRLMQRVDR